MRKEVEAYEAAELLLGAVREAGEETLPIGASLGRVTSRDIYAGIPFPPFDRSPFDGYAFVAQDTAGATAGSPVTLRINQEIPAGHMPSAQVGSGYAAKILTGAPIPPGADAVVKFEDTEFTADEVRLSSPSLPGSNIVRAGEDVPAGKALAARGAQVTPAMMGLFAAQGMKDVPVFRRPAITVVNTGTELAELGRPLPPGMIYNSSMFTLQGFVQGMGADFRDGGVVADDEALIAERVAEAAKSADIVFTTGGASVGDYDCALRAARLSGGEILFWKVKMKPGGSMLAYVLGGKLVLALSGNPGAAVLGLLRIALPCIRKAAGRSDVMPETCMVHLRRALPKENPRLRVIRGCLEIEDGKAWFAENAGQGGGDISSFVRCDLLCEIPAGCPPLEAGALVKAYRIGV